MKKCTKCQVEKDLSLFAKSSKTKDGKRCQCKECDKIDRKKYDKEYLTEYRRKYYSINKDVILQHNKEYRKKNIESINKQRKDAQLLNPDIIKHRSKKYYADNKAILSEKAKVHREKNKDSLKEKARIRLINRRKTDVVFKLKCNISRLILSSLKSRGYVKNTKTVYILGCDIDAFKKHLESKFEPWMTWDNRGLYNGDFNYGWDLDHIIPIKSAKTEEDVIRLNHYTNFQPLCGKTNREIKNGKY